ncbi:MAG: hypothetical protein LC799_32940 [Actinobacteria bacterium]|nr:hypothetical protein [Actinomycetota bacterium]
MAPHRVDKGTYTLAEAATAPAEEAPAGKPEAKPRARKRQQEKHAAKTTSETRLGGACGYLVKRPRPK